VPAIFIGGDAPWALVRGWRLTQTQSSVTGVKADEEEQEHHQALRQQMDVWSILLIRPFREIKKVLWKDEMMAENRLPGITAGS
jgi:hypothetical protein